jgi:ribosomal protein L9
MGLKKYQIASVSPGAARNHLVPTKAAVYAHYVNRELYKHEIETAQAEGSAEPEDQQAIRARVQQARLLKRLKALKLVCSQVLFAPGSSLRQTPEGSSHELSE